MTHDTDESDVRDELLRLIQLGNEQYDQLVELDEADWSRNDEKSALLREWWLTTAQTLRTFGSYAYTSVEHELFPEKMIGRLAKLSEDLAGGNIHALVEDARKNKALQLGERECIAVAIRYKDAVASGEIEDHRPTSRICELFKVKPPTVHKWMNQRDKRLLGIHDRGLRGHALAEELQLAGGAYRKWGYYGTEKHQYPPTEGS